MDNEDKKKPVPEAREKTALHFGQEMSTSLKWLNERAWPLGGVIFLTAYLYLYDYITTEKVALSIASPSAVAALPSIFAMVLLLGASLVILLSAPTILFFVSPRKGEKAWVQLFQSHEISDRKIVRFLTIVWLLSVLALGIGLWLLIWSLLVWNPNATSSWGIALTFLLSVGLLAGPMIAFNPKAKPFREITAGYWFACIGSAVLQGLLLVSILQPAINVFTQLINISTDSFAGLFPVFALVAMAVALSQIVVAFLIQLGHQHSRPLAVIGITSAVLIFSGALIRPVGAWVVGRVVQMTSFGGRICAVLTFAPSADARHPQLREGNDSNSRRLHGTFEADGIYQVRLINSEDKPIFFVPRADVASMGDCPKPEKSR